MARRTHEIFKDIPRGDTSRYLKEQSAPRARWQSPEKIAASRILSYNPADPEKKVLVGAFGEKLVGIEDNRHILTVAGSRSGKSVTVIANLLCYRGSVLATDPKGELATITASARARMGQKVHVLDPFGYCPSSLDEFRAGYNPLSVLKITSPTIIEDAGLIAEAIVVRAQGSRDDHWDESAQNFIEGVILHVATSPEHREERHLVTVRELIKQAMRPDPDATDDEPLAALERAMLENAANLGQWPGTADIGGAIEGAARDFYEKSDRERDSVLSVVRRHTKFLDYTAMRQTVMKHDFDLADLKRLPEGMTVYLCFPATRIEMSNRWLRIFINQLLDAMERVKERPPAPVLACLDEFPVLGYMRQLENAVGQLASFDVKLWVLLQDWSQGKALYGERWESFAANAGILQFFGNNDLTTTEYISKRLGKTLVEVARQGEVAPDSREHGLTGRTESLDQYDLMTPEEIMRYFARNDSLKRQIIMWTGYHPMILQRVEYFDKKGPFFQHIQGRLLTSE
ncbi:type IV secretory system conjugative DNA transfer family protein [Marinobacterium sedimentorum]|uniref:type IV secretory system conjugative DNA transfer family protein n=1 Tax=Marinobacterium sedimentorum TaxID=2927804 RepID=UPI0020C5CD0F|nr:type IV secretory system conjugative DNA transfer family protein [Marinobacterium sedimentorum]MCP8685945.1 type IV secretory system conjugative DNA transfer family protein [Marinobacterium sedimentorum]